MLLRLQSNRIADIFDELDNRVGMIMVDGNKLTIFNDRENQTIEIDLTETKWSAEGILPLDEVELDPVYFKEVIKDESNSQKQVEKGPANPSSGVA